MKPVEWINDLGETNYQPVLSSGAALWISYAIPGYVWAIEQPRGSKPVLYNTKRAARGRSERYEEEQARNTWRRK